MPTGTAAAGHYTSGVSAPASSGSDQSSMSLVARASGSVVRVAIHTAPTRPTASSPGRTNKPSRPGSSKAELAGTIAHPLPAAIYSATTSASTIWMSSACWTTRVKGVRVAPFPDLPGKTEARFIT